MPSILFFQLDECINSAGFIAFQAPEIRWNAPLTSSSDPKNKFSTRLNFLWWRKFNSQIFPRLTVQRSAFFSLRFSKHLQQRGANFEKPLIVAYYGLLKK